MSERQSGGSKSGSPSSGGSQKLGGPKIAEKIERRRMMRTGQKAREAAKFAGASAQTIKQKLLQYVERSKKRKAKRIPGLSSKAKDIEKT